MSRAEELRTQVQLLETALFGRLKLPREDERIRTALNLIADSNITSSGVVGVEALVIRVLELRVEALKASVRAALDQH